MANDLLAKGLEYSTKQVAETLGVSPATMSRPKELFHQTISVEEHQDPEDFNHASNSH